jgi:hypothetical protein
MKRTIVGIALAVVALASFAQEQHRLNLALEQHSAVKQQVADQEEWLRSRPHQDSATS